MPKLGARGTRSLGQPAGKASNYIQTWDTLIRGDRVVLCLRESSDKESDRRLADQEANLRKQLFLRGVVVVDKVSHVGSGYSTDWLRKLRSAARFARKHRAKLVAESTSRFIRNPAYHSVKSPSSQASESDLEDLRLYTLGVVLVTLLHPDASWQEERGCQSSRGQEETGQKGGGDRRPGWKKKRRKRLLRDVLELRTAKKSVREISKLVNVPPPTVHAWIKRYA